MINEKERKFLVVPSTSFYDLLKSIDYKLVEQGYFTEGGAAVRVSVTSRPYMSPMHDVGKFCAKGPSVLEDGFSVRKEYEFTIPAPDARGMLDIAPTYISKYYWELKDGWEISIVQLKQHNGLIYPLVIAEFELDGKRVFPETLPDWIFKEVTEDEQYSMRALAWKYGKK